MKDTVAAFCMLAALAACGKEPPPRSVHEFVEDPILLEATMVRCGQDRAASRYDAECLNARDAAGRIAAAGEQARREELEAQSEQKRQALRRAREAAAEARRRVQEAERRREEASYFGEFEPLPPGDDASEDEASERDRDGSPDDAPQDPAATTPPEGVATELPATRERAPDPASDAGEDAGEVSLEEIREELRRRQERPR